jgi:hypothetical protein
MGQHWPSSTHRGSLKAYSVSLLFGRGSKRVQDEWGFSSANPSRSQSPGTRGRADAEA